MLSELCPWNDDGFTGNCQLFWRMASTAPWNTTQPVTLVTLYRPPGPFVDFLSTLVVNSYKVLIVGDSNIHMDNENSSLTISFQPLIDSVRFSQHVNTPIHYFNHIIDLVLVHALDQGWRDVQPPGHVQPARQFDPTNKAIHLYKKKLRNKIKKQTQTQCPDDPDNLARRLPTWL